LGQDEEPDFTVEQFMAKLTEGEQE